MKTLSIYDIDDTIFFANQSIIVIADNGEEVDHIDHEEYKRREDAGEHHYKYSWRMLENSEDFCNTLKPNHVVIEQLIKDLQNPDIDVMLLTARTSPDNVHQFREAFSWHGMHLGDAELVFAGDNSPGDRSWLNKTIEFEKIFGSQQYDHITIYDDSERNLQAFWMTQLDYPNVSTSIKWVDPVGHIQQYYGPIG